MEGPVLAKHVHHKIHGSGRAGRFNAWLAVKITDGVGTMWCAYAFCIVALVGLPSAVQQSQSQGPLPIVQWIAQTFIQLVLLSIIMVGQQVISAHADARAQKDFETNVKAEQEIEKVLEKLLSIEQQQSSILERMEANASSSKKGR